MKTTEIVGFKRDNLGKASSKQLRGEGNVPCVLYGNGEEAVHFHSPMYLFKDLLYTPDAFIVKLNVEGVECQCILQDVQFHPVSEIILHVDFLKVYDDKPVSIDVPVVVEGRAPGVADGGQIFVKSKKLRVKALPANLPEFVIADVSELTLGSSFRVKDLKTEGYEIVTSENVTIVSVVIPRALKSTLGDDEGVEEAEEAEGAEAEAEA